MRGRKDSARLKKRWCAPCSKAHPNSFCTETKIKCEDCEVRGPATRSKRSSTRTVDWAVGFTVWVRAGQAAVLRSADSGPEEEEMVRELRQATPGGGPITAAAALHGAGAAAAGGRTRLALLPQLTAATHCRNSLQQLTAATHCRNSLPQLTAGRAR